MTGGLSDADLDAIDERISSGNGDPWEDLRRVVAELRTERAARQRVEALLDEREASNKFVLYGGDLGPAILNTTEVRAALRGEPR